MKAISLPIRLKRCILHQIPHAARTGTGAESASDAKALIHDIFIRAIFQIFSADGILGSSFISSKEPVRSRKKIPTLEQS
jgi:hypothetical protein